MDEKEVIITYENLYEILRREKFRTELQNLDPEFFANVKKYLSEKKSILTVQKQKDSIFASTEVEKTKIQLKNIQKILKELYEKREGKIVQLALFHSRSLRENNLGPMLEEEKKLYEAIKKGLDGFRSEILLGLLATEAAPPKEKDLKITGNQNCIIKLVKDVPEFVGPDLNTYGPYIQGQQIKLQKNIAEMLVKQNQAENENSQENETVLSEV
ncbi:MAG: hypothetical protein ABIF40_00230 [archaeon]